MKYLLLISCLIGFSVSFSQVSDSLSQSQQDSIKKIDEAIAHRKNHTDYYVMRKGKMFFSWGYNRAFYGLSDIHFKGDGYDFTIRDAVAKDRPSKFEPNVYFNPQLFTIPQYNFRIGYYITNKLSLTFNVDHMKYVFQEDQIATVDGFIDSSASSRLAGDYDNKLMKVDEDFIKYEHTDGLNFLSIDLDYNDLFFETYHRKFAVDLVAGVSLGATVPKTNAWLFDKKGNDAFHWSGIGMSANVGLKLFFFKRFFIHPTVKAGYITMPNVATNGLENDKASQNFTFFQWNATVGYQFRLTNK